MSVKTKQRVLTPEMVAEIEAFLPRYPTKQAVTLPALHIVNEHLRHVPLAAVVEIAEILDLAPSQVQDTMTFYKFFKQEAPHGKTRAWVCHSISCALRGGEDVLKHMCDKAGIQPGETTPDSKLSIEAAECLGGCDFAPCMLADGKLHKDMTKEKVDQFLKEVNK